MKCDFLTCEAFLAQLTKGCETKSADWDARSKTRADELSALSDTIDLLNNDDVLAIVSVADGQWYKKYWIFVPQGSES